MLSTFKSLSKVFPDIADQTERVEILQSTSWIEEKFAFNDGRTIKLWLSYVIYFLFCKDEKPKTLRFYSG